MFTKKLFEKNYPFGFTIYKYEDDKDCTITGSLAKEYRFRDFDGNYELEEYLQKHINCDGIDFDSEYSQFFAYTRTEERAMRFCKDIQTWFDNIKKLIN